MPKRTYEIRHPRTWVYAGTAKGAAEDAARALARSGAIWVPGNLAPRKNDAQPGDVVILVWRAHGGDQRGRVLGVGVVAPPLRPWGRTTWLDTVGTDDPLFAMSQQLGFAGPRNYRTMLRLDRWTEDPGEIRRRTGETLPHLSVGAWVSGLPARKFLFEVRPGQLQAVNLAEPDPLLSRITVDASVLGGKPTVRGLRIAVEHVLEWMATGASAQEIVAAYPELEEADVRACLRYAERRVANERIEPAVSSG